MKSYSNRSLLIDSINQTITEIEVPKANEAWHIHNLIYCECFSEVKLGSGISLLVDDEGLYRIKRQANPPHDVSQGFFVTHSQGVPRHLIAGKGLISAYNSKGETIDLPAWVTPTLIQRHIKFVADEHRNAAAELCAEILARVGVTANPAEFEEHDRRYAEIVRRAMALTI